MKSPQRAGFAIFLALMFGACWRVCGAWDWTFAPFRETGGRQMIL
jgi:hypothetical protein